MPNFLQHHTDFEDLDIYMMSESIDWSKTGMEYRHLGRTGLKVSALSLGAWTTYGGTSDQNTCGDVRRRQRFVTQFQ